MAKAIGHSTPESALAMAIVAIHVAPPLPRVSSWSEEYFTDTEWGQNVAQEQ